MIRVLVAEDSLTVRELLVEILESDPRIKVVGQAKNGVEAVELAMKLKPDLVTMDIHMPLMDGFEATKEIMVRAPAPIILVSSSVSRGDVQLSFDAMRAGALMVVAKPDSPRSPLFDGRREQFLAMVKAMSEVKVVRRWATVMPVAALPAGPRPTPGTRARLIAIAASTGGPGALLRVLSDLPGDIPVPILVVQHIATGFAEGLASWLAASCDLRVKVAEAGEQLRERSVYLAPDERHLGVSRDSRLVLSDDPPIGGFRPSGSFLFASVAEVYGPAVAAVILTGMGSDGVEGLRAVKRAGGRILAQDEATSVVYGMPRVAVEAGVVDEVVPIGQIGSRLTTLTAGGPHA